MISHYTDERILRFADFHFRKKEKENVIYVHNNRKSSRSLFRAQLHIKIVQQTSNLQEK